MKTSTISLMGEKVLIEVDRHDFYRSMLDAIVERVFQLLGPQFDKRRFLEEVEKGRMAVEIGQEMAIPVSIMLSLELGYCLGQLKTMGRHYDCEKALADLYAIWKTRLKKLLDEEIIARRPLH
jgi:hypothetical protein